MPAKPITTLPHTELISPDIAASHTIMGLEVNKEIVILSIKQKEYSINQLKLASPVLEEFRSKLELVTGSIIKVLRLNTI